MPPSMIFSRQVRQGVVGRACPRLWISPVRLLDPSFRCFPLRNRQWLGRGLRLAPLFPVPLVPLSRSPIPRTSQNLSVYHLIVGYRPDRFRVLENSRRSWFLKAMSRLLLLLSLRHRWLKVTISMRLSRLLKKSSSNLNPQQQGSSLCLRLSLSLLS